MLWPNMVKSASLQWHSTTCRVKKLCTLQESVKDNEHLVSFVLLLRLLVMRVMLASLRFPMNSLRQRLMTSLTCQCPNDPKWILQMATHPSGSSWIVPLFCSVLAPCALAHASAAVHSLALASCCPFYCGALRGFAGATISISQISPYLQQNRQILKLHRPRPSLTFGPKEAPTHHLGQIMLLCSKYGLVLNSSDCAQKVSRCVELMCLMSTGLTLQLVQIGRFLTRSSLCRNLEFYQHCMQGQNFDLGWDRRWAWHQDCQSSQGKLINHRFRKWPAFANSSSLTEHCVKTF